MGKKIVFEKEVIEIDKENVEALIKYIFEYEQCTKLSNNEIAQKLKKGLWASLSIGSMASNLLMEAIERLETEEKYSKEIDILSTELMKEKEDKYLLQTTIIDLRMAIQLLLDHIDYTRGACSVADMVGDALPVINIAQVREALSQSLKIRQKDYNNELLNDCAWFAEKHRGKNKQSGAHWSTIIRFTPLFDEAARLQQRVDTLEAYIADYPVPTDTYCAYCGAKFPLDNDAAHLVSEHIRTCEKHPMRHAESEIKRLMDEVKESNGLLRSAFMIAKRDGKETNWEAWHNQLSVALARQHAIIYGKDEK